MRNNIVIFITKVWYGCRNIKDTALCETGYYSTSGSNLIQIGVNTVFSGSGKPTDFFWVLGSICSPGSKYGFVVVYRDLSIVARGGGGLSPPIDLPTKMQIKKNTTFLALLRLFFALDWTKK